MVKQYKSCLVISFDMFDCQLGRVKFALVSSVMQVFFVFIHLYICFRRKYKKNFLFSLQICRKISVNMLWLSSIIAFRKSAEAIKATVKTTMLNGIAVLIDGVTGIGFKIAIVLIWGHLWQQVSA